MSAVAFVTTFNCEKYIGRTIQSIADQTYKSIKVKLVDDGSSDRTIDVAMTTLKKNSHLEFEIVRNEFNLGKAANAYKYLNDETSDFVFIVDGDDHLIDNDIIKNFAMFFEGGYDVVWSNFRMAPNMIGICKPLDPNLHPRRQSWRTSHLFSFRHL